MYRRDKNLILALQYELCIYSFKIGKILYCILVSIKFLIAFSYLKCLLVLTLIVSQARRKRLRELS